MASTRNNATFFVAGATAATLIPYLLRNIKKVGRKQEIKSVKSTEDGIRSRSSEKVVMDSPDLDNRILRKAEGALRMRTSRLIIVVERCTNDHNYRLAKILLLL